MNDHYIKSKTYDDYVKSQTNTNKRKINSVWVTDDEINKIYEYCQTRMISVEFGICHGVRNGYEVEKFNSLFGSRIIGTDISETATQFENVIQWDFHDAREDWIGKFDFIYSNSIDHSYDFDKCLTNWMASLSTRGRCFIEWSDAISKPYDQADCFGISKLDLIELINKSYEVEAEFAVAGNGNRIIIVIKHQL